MHLWLGHRESPFGRLTFKCIPVFGTLIVLCVLSLATITPAAATTTPAWVQQSPAQSPSARYAASMAYDSATSQLVLFGGAGDSGLLADTWIWDGSTWTQQSPATSPPALYYASIAYDPATSQLVLFGGYGDSANAALAGTWTWDGSTWTQQAPAVSPPARSSASMAYDPATSQLVLFGGYGQSGLLGDTWTWDGSNWAELSPAASPSARGGSSMAYDPATSQLVLFGGGYATTLLADTWTWDGTTWTQQSPATNPTARAYSSMAYDPATSQLVLFGGLGDPSGPYGLFGDTWTWDGGTWTQQEPSASPSARQDADMAYDPAASQLVMFGGVDPGPLGDTWTYNPGQEPQSITFSTAAPSSTSYSGANNRTYTASATATSGLPVALSIDSASTSGCTISGDTVSYGGGVGTCIIDGNQPGNSSYLPAPSVTQSFRIRPAPLSIIASSSAMTYGGAIPVITARYSRFAGNDTASSLSTLPSCSTTATSASPAGTSPSTCSGAADPNYKISYIPGNVTVRKATTATTLTSEPDPSTRRSPVTLTATVMPMASSRTPAGDVNFYAVTPANHKFLGTASLTSSGTAVVTTTTLPCGRRRLYAVYLGSANDIGSTSAIVILTIHCSD